VIDELTEHQRQIGFPDETTSSSGSRERIQREITYYNNHSHLMQYPEYRQQGLPLTSSGSITSLAVEEKRGATTERFLKLTTPNSKPDKAPAA